MSDTIEHVFNNHAAVLRDLGRALTTAHEIRFTAAPGSAREGSRGIPDPTLDTVMEPRRVAVSDAIGRAGAVLRKASDEVRAITSVLDSSVAAWHGEPLTLEEEGTITP